MKKTGEIHPIQALILRDLLFKTEAKFSELNLSNDHFTFHINQLLSLSLVEKNLNGHYQLTTPGKEFANRMDTEKVVMEKQAKIGVLLVCIRKRGGKVEFLIHQRLKQPYFGFYGFHTGKIRWGETIEEAASRELQEETGFTAKVTLVGIKHKMDYSKDNNLLEDKYFYTFRCTICKGVLQENFEGGRNLWLTKDEIRKLPNLFDGIEGTLQMAEKAKLSFSENKYIVSGY